VQKLAVRIANHLNVHFYRGRARRRTNPMKLPALICMHDKHTRRHLAMVFGLPAGGTLADFRQTLRHILVREPFVFSGAVDDDRACKIEAVYNLAASIRYNAKQSKSLTRNPIVYVHTPPSPSNELGEQNEQPKKESHAADHVVGASR
jgi:hypothetical protein